MRPTNEDELGSLIFWLSEVEIELLRVLAEESADRGCQDLAAEPQLAPLAVALFEAARFRRSLGLSPG